MMQSWSEIRPYNSEVQKFQQLEEEMNWKSIINTNLKRRILLKIFNPLVMLNCPTIEIWLIALNSETENIVF